jgi:hypothetical protein
MSSEMSETTTSAAPDAAEKPAIAVGKVVGDGAAAEQQGGGGAEADANAPKGKIDAMVCLPGLGEGPGLGFLDVADRISTAMERSAGGPAVFSIATRDVKTRQGKAVRSVAIRRHDTPKATPREVLHLFELDYRPALKGELAKRPPAVQAVVMAWTLLFVARPIASAFLLRRSKSWVHQLQVIYGGALFVGMLLYLGLLLAGAIQAVKKPAAPASSAQALAGSTPAPASPTTLAATPTQASAFPATSAATPAQTAASPVKPAATSAQTPAKPAATSAQASAFPARTASTTPATGAARPNPARTNVASTKAARSHSFWTTPFFWAGDQAKSAAKRIAAKARAAYTWAVAGRDAHGGWWGWLASLVIVIPLAGAFLRFNVRDALSRAAPTLASASSYLIAGQNRNEIIGDLGDVLEHLKEEGGYERVHLAAYSFGSIVAIDALFQHDSEVSRRFREITTLITIGCPYDFVRTYWPRYFGNRYPGPGGQTFEWINVYCPIDVLGSNFIDEPTRAQRSAYRRAKPPERKAMLKEWDEKYRSGVDLVEGDPARPKFANNIPFGPGQGGTASFGEWAAFAGFRVHGMYWSRASASAVNCFEPIVTRLYAAEQADVLA